MEAYAIYKLIILYMLDRAGDQLAMPQISNFLFETGYATFTSLSKTFEEINADGFVEEHFFLKRGTRRLLLCQRHSRKLTPTASLKSM